MNCAALPDELLESELFGHTRGAFTGAVTDKPGLFEEAHGGTLFLDEVADLSLRGQAKLLRVLQQHEVRRVGETFSRKVDVRVVTAANRDMRTEVAANRFRLDLLYRLDVIRIRIPPLRERPEDVSVLANHFWRASSAQRPHSVCRGRDCSKRWRAWGLRHPQRGVTPRRERNGAGHEPPTRVAARQIRIPAQPRGFGSVSCQCGGSHSRPALPRSARCLRNLCRATRCGRTGHTGSSTRWRPC